MLASLRTLPVLVAAACAALSACVDVPAKRPLMNVSLEACMATTLEKYPGQVIRYELVKAYGRTYHAYTVYPGDGTAVGVACDANSGIVYWQWNRRASPAHDPYRIPPKMSEVQARWVALSLSSGTIIELVYTTAPTPQYTYVILTPENTWLKVAVDGTSGEPSPVPPRH